MSDTSLRSSLRPFRRRVVAIGLATGVGWGLAASLLVLAIGMWLDLVLELPAGLRVTLLSVALGLGVVLVLWACGSALRRSTAAVVAWRLDRIGGTGGQVLSGVDLSRAAGRLPGITGGLAELAVRRAAGLARRVPRHLAVPARPMGYAFGTVACLVVAGGIAAMLMPELAHKQWARFFQPHDDHPPYSPLIFEVQPGDVELRYGDPLEIRAKVSGGTVDRAEVVIEAADGAEPETLPMFPEPDGAWRAMVTHTTASGSYWVRAHRGRSDKFNIKVITVPRLENARFRVTPPAYANRPPYEGPLPQGGLAGLVGTRVEVWIESNRPLSGGTIDLVTDQHEDRLEMMPTAEDGKEVKGVFEIHEAGKAHMRVIDVDGQPSREVLTAPIALLTDERPFIRLLEPQAVSLAVANVDLPITLSAEDDYGISRVQLYRSLNDSRALPADVALPRPPPTRQYDRLALPLRDYGLSPGDEIKLYARVEDNDPAGPKGSESPIAVVRIISQADFERLLRVKQGMEVLQSKYEQAQRRVGNTLDEIERLLKELNEQPPESDVSQPMKEQLDRLAQQMEREAAAIRLLAQMPLPYDLDAKLNPELEKLARMLDQAARDLNEAKRGPSIPKAGGMADKLKALAQACGGGKKDFQEEVIAPLEHLARILPLLQDEARFLTLYGQQKNLAERLASLKGRDGEDNPQLKARMRDMEEEQRKLREDLQALIEDIENHITRLPDDPRLKDLRDTAQKFAEDVRVSGAAEAMAEAQAALAEFSGTRAHENAREAADILDSFIARCQGMGQAGQACLKFQPKLSSCLGDTVQQLLADLGMEPASGFGMGEGAGGGYSASRSTLENVGLYGGLPAMGEMTRLGSGASSLLGGPGSGLGMGDNQAESSAVDPTGTLQASGAGEAAVPVQYRSRVGAYLQRIADEIGE